MGEEQDLNKAINYEQLRLKEAALSSPELAQVYLERVNTFQAHIEETYEKIEALKAAQKPKWQELEESCEDLQSAMLEQLLSLNDEDLLREKDSFDTTIDHFLSELHQKTEQAEAASEKPTSTYEIFKKWELPFDEEQLEDFARLANDNYGEDEIRKLDSRIVMIEALPVEIKQQIFGVDVALDLEAIIGQLANGTLQDSKNAFLLKEPEHLLRKLDQNLEDKAQEITDDLESLNKKFQSAVTNWAEKTAAKESEEASKSSYNEVMKIEKEISTKRTSLLQLKFTQEQLNASLTFYNATNYINEGNTQLGSRILLNLRERHGNLGNLHPSIDEAYQRALILLVRQLSDFEKNLHFDLDAYKGSRGVKAYRIETAIKTAIKNYRTKDLANDLSENTSNEKAPATFKYSNYKTPKPREVRENKPVKLLERRNVAPKPLATMFSRDQAFFEDGRANLVDVHIIGWQPEFKKKLIDVTTQAGETFCGIELSPDAKEFIGKTPKDMKVALTRKPSNIKLSKEPYLETTDNSNVDFTEARIVEFHDTITAEDLIYTKRDGNNLTIINSLGDVRELNFAEIEKESENKTRDLLRVINCDADFGRLIGVAASIHGPLQNLEKLFTAGTEGKKYEDFVNYTRDNAVSILKVLDKNSQSELAKAKEKIALLKDLDFGHALSPLEAEISNKIKVIESMIGILENKNLRQTLEAIVDKGSWHEDDFLNWLKYNGAKILLTVALTVAITLSVVASCGGSLPMLAMAGVTVGTAVVTGEIVSEVMYQIVQATDEDIKSGKATYKSRSLLGKYLAGEKILDSETNQYIEMDFLKHVIGDYSKQFFAGFVTAFAAMGLGKLCSQFWSSTLQNSRITTGLKANYPKMSQILSKLNKLQNVENLTGEAKTIAKKYAVGVLDGLSDELKTMGASEMLTSIDERLAGLAAFVVVIQKEFHPLGNVNLDSKDVGTFSYSKNTPVEKWAKTEGYQVLSKNAKGEFEIGIQNYVFKLVPEAA